MRSISKGTNIALKIRDDRLQREILVTEMPIQTTGDPEATDGTPTQHG
jgi:hypothetical protein